MAMRDADRSAARIRRTVRVDTARCHGVDLRALLLEAADPAQLLQEGNLTRVRVSR